MKVKNQIPNLITLSNLMCGVLSIVAVTQGEVALGAYMILGGVFFDFFDGLAARALGVSGELGKQLDSLADVVTFGAAPVFIALHLVGTLSVIPDKVPDLILGFAPILMAAFGAYRLAAFNIDERQSDKFIGMPTPAVALFWVAVALISVGSTDEGLLGAVYAAFLASPPALVVSSLVLAVLMVIPLPLIALKFKSYGLRGNEFRYLLLASSVALLAFFAVKAVPIILLLYIALSVIENIRSSNNGIQSSN